MILPKGSVVKTFPRNNDKVIVESIGTISVKGDCDYVR
jgi:hypothetical protein